MSSSQDEKTPPLPPGRDCPLAEWPRYWAERRPTSLAIRDESRELDWLAFEARVERAACALQSKGIEAGDRIALLLGNRTAYLELFFAAARIGAILTPINIRLTAHEIAFQVGDCRPVCLVHEHSLRPVVKEALALSNHRPTEVWSLGGEPDDYESLLNASSATVSDSSGVGSEEPVLLMYTSGTTGSPKGALLPARKVFFNSLNASLYFENGPSDRVLVVAPLFHSLALQILALPIMRAGGGLVLQSEFEPVAVWDAVDRFGITYFGGVPAMHQRLDDVLSSHERSHWNRSALRFVFTAGSAASVELIRSFQEQGILMIQGYGQTETSILTCLSAEDALRCAGSVGRPVRHGEVRVVDRSTAPEDPTEWRETEPDETGEIVVRGPLNMLRYWEEPEATARTMKADWLCTGDLARRDPEGFITLVGRTREMFISGGENVMPAEVEAVYREHPDIRDVAVVGEVDPKWGEVGRAHLVLEPGARVSAAGLDAWARSRLAAFKVPRRYVIETEFPRTASGKIQKFQLSFDPARLLA
ncbi:MAG: p-hydroxycinnamoyl-CoA synthetase [Spirochaeta sp.]|nr:p-hydroxycinnamoyl-CoA synthetase [Spirochaeta sp.]RPG08116.1 MAG: p-hydroxycinnamoyl-CoA synthetase [Proteobacteria bacterium TMED72]